MMILLVEVKLWWDVAHHQKLLTNIFGQQRELSNGEIRQEVWIRGLNTRAIRRNDKVLKKFGLDP